MNVSRETSVKHNLTEYYPKGWYTFPMGEGCVLFESQKN